MSEKRFRAWITKYALTSGVKVAMVDYEDDGFVRDVDTSYYYRGEGRNWHRTRESAVDRVRELRVAKLIALRKQIAKLEKMEIEVPE